LLTIGEKMRSSYLENNYKRIFFALVEAFRPPNCIELGVLDGYSSVAIGKGLKHNFTLGRTGMPRLDSYDLWGDYQYKHGDTAQVQETINSEGLKDYIFLHKGDALKVHENYGPRSVQLLHVDISNTGDILKYMVEAWTEKLCHWGLLLFEGGTKERDEVEWMVKYNKKPIRPELHSNPDIQKFYTYGTYRHWPGLTVMVKTG